MKTIIATLLAGAALLAAPVANAQRHRATPEEKLAKLLDGRVAGKPVDGKTPVGGKSAEPAAPKPPGAEPKGKPAPKTQPATPPPGRQR